MVNINLLPPELKLRRIHARRNASLISISLVMVIIFAVLGIVARSFESTITANLGNIKADVEKGNVNLDEFKDLQDLALLINDRSFAADEINKNRVFWSQVMQELANNAPSDVQFESLVGNSEKSPNFTLQGNTTTEREIIKFKEKLENSPMFKNVSFKSSSLGKDQEQKLSFTLEFDLEQKHLQGSVSQWKTNQLQFFC